MCPSHCVPCVLCALPAAPGAGAALLQVSATAFASLRRVGGVVQNQEIAHHVEVLLKALENPSAETDNALEALLFTRFCTSVDAPALALIYPILYRGLRERVTSTKMKVLPDAMGLYVLRIFEISASNLSALYQDATASDACLSRTESHLNASLGLSDM